MLAHNAVESLPARTAEHTLGPVLVTVSVRLTVEPVMHNSLL
jgi:hypothetical protein